MSMGGRAEGESRIIVQFFSVNDDQAALLKYIVGPTLEDRIIFKLRLGASISRSVGLSVSLSVCLKLKN